MITTVSSPTGSAAFFSIALLVISLLVLLLLRHYLPIRTTPAYLVIPVFLALALPSSIILLVPIDLASNAIKEDGIPRGIWLPDKVMLAVWRIAYWLTFVLTWFVLPLLGDYADAGHRDPRERVKYSIHTNLRYQLAIFAAGAIGLVYFFLQAGVHIGNLKATIMALAYAWGLILAIYLMGHGLVDIPRRLFKGASTAGRLRQLQSNAPQVHERMSEAIENLNQLEEQVLQLKKRKTGTARDFQDWIDDLVETSDLPESRPGLSPNSIITDTTASSTVPAVITDRYLADLTRKLKRARHRRIRFIEEWDRLVRDATNAQAILDSSASKKLTFPSSTVPTTLTSSKSLNLARFLPTTLLTPYMRYLLHTRLLPLLRLLTASLLALASITLIWSETTHSISSRLSIVGLSLIHHPHATSNGKINIFGQILAALWLLYMCTAALSSIRIVKVWGNRALVRRHTYPESATWYATQVAKLTVPLSYNFITLLPRDIYEDTAFYSFLGRQIDLTTIGTGFSRFFPIFVLIPVLATAFGLYGRVRRVAGFGAVFDDADEQDSSNSAWGTGGWREGKALIERERLGGAGSRAGLGLASRDASPSARARPSGGAGAGARYTDASAEDERQALIRPYTDDDEGEGDATNQPALSLPPSSSAAEWAQLPSTSTSSTRPQQPQRYTDNPSRQRGQQFAPARGQAVDEDDDDGNFFIDFAHRVRNTLDTVDRPDFTLPKWLKRGGGNGRGGGGRGRGGFGRIFSGNGNRS